MVRRALEVITEVREDTLVVRFRGAVDSATVDDFKAALDEVKRNGRRRVVVDFAELRYINSTALGLLAGFRKQMYISGGRVVLAGVRGPVANSMRLLRLDKVFRIYPDLGAALENINRDTVIG